jgi:16S rRNA (guanine527-N7)-methyltransferase
VRDRRDPLPTRVDLTPDLPPEYGAVLGPGLDALGIDLQRHERQAIDGHARLLLAWTQAINLTAIRDPVAVAREHVLDSLSALPLLRERGVEGVLDIGSGGGYPGIPLAIALPGRSLLVESIGKKARFLRVAVEATGLSDRVGVAAVRVESLAANKARKGWSAVVARGVAPLGELAELALPLLRVGGVLVAWKRIPFEEEADRARQAVSELGGGDIGCHPVALEGLEDHVLVTVEKRAATPARFPRDPAERRRSL